MKKNWIKMILLSAMVLTGCANQKSEQDQLTEIQEKGVLVVGTEGTYSPNSYHDEEGNLVGFDVEVAKAIGEHLGVEVEFFEAEWDSLFAAMDSGRVDTVINEVEYSEDRAEKYDFSEAYTYVHGALLVADDNTDITSFEDLEGKRAAQNLTSSWGRMAEEYGAELVSVDTLNQVMDLLSSDRADATLNAETAFGDYMRNHPEEPVKIVALTETTSSSLIPVRKGEQNLLEAINQALEEMRQSGELKAISEKYFGMDVTSNEVR